MEPIDDFFRILKGFSFQGPHKLIAYAIRMLLLFGAYSIRTIQHPIISVIIAILLITVLVIVILVTLFRK